MVHCPLDARPGQKIRFQLPIQLSEAQLKTYNIHYSGKVSTISPGVLLVESSVFFSLPSPLPFVSFRVKNIVEELLRVVLYNGKNLRSTLLSSWVRGWVWF